MYILYPPWSAVWCTTLHKSQKDFCKNTDVLHRIWLIDDICPYNIHLLPIHNVFKISQHIYSNPQHHTLRHFLWVLVSIACIQPVIHYDWWTDPLVVQPQYNRCKTSNCILSSVAERPSLKQFSSLVIITWRAVHRYFTVLWLTLIHCVFVNLPR